MTQIILIVIIVVLVILLFVKSIRQKIVGICQSALNQTISKNSNKQKILDLLGEKNQLSNTEIRDAIGVTDRTVVNYMDQLEKESKVEQVGSTGRGVFYRLK